MQQAAIEKAKGKWEKMRKSSMRLKRIGEWIQYCVDGGNVFFYNETTGEFQWERPVELANTNEGGAGGAGELEASPWCAYKDPATGMTFYHNATSGARNGSARGSARPTTTTRWSRRGRRARPAMRSGPIDDCGFKARGRL